MQAFGQLILFLIVATAVAISIFAAKCGEKVEAHFSDPENAAKAAEALKRLAKKGK
ncbi:hypothetical protein [Paludisphaera rhizosphaerae]|uniref:hypothetical protein n=1 Tax=Paludisphaera rhizosphaerae TaxID=2711216 RepID=UPI0013EABCE7|nr:hypothetical protein [Paludisphaera rhizosphaerae]